jgi:tripartite-type tricarboxylate transporter receptor subunit TctC
MTRSAIARSMPGGFRCSVRRRASVLAGFVLLPLLMLLAPTAFADDRPLRIVVGFPPGGTLDVIARVVADRLRVELDGPVIVENRPGAGSLIAAELVAKGPADGTMLLAAPLVVTSFFPHIFKTLSFDPLVDLAPVAQLGTFRFALVVGPGVPATDFAGFVRYVKARPGKTSFGSVSAGTPSHFIGVMLNRSADLDMVHIPYKGGAPAMTALQGGEVDAIFDVVTNTVQQHKAGRVRVLAVTGNERSPQLPDVPTFKEARLELADIDNVTFWYGFFAPGATPRATIEKLNRALVAALSNPEVKTRLAGLDIGAEPTTVAEFTRTVKTDATRWGAVIRSTGFTASE